MNFPENLWYTQDHEWIKFEEDFALVGITDFAQKELGDIVFVDIDTLGQEINQNEIFGTIEAVKTVSDLFLPIEGKLIEINPIIESSPEKVNTDPYNDGWLVKIVFSKATDRSNLLGHEDYKKLIGIN